MSDGPTPSPGASLPDDAHPSPAVDGATPDEGPPVDPDRVYLYDTTLRDGAQTSGVDFSLEDKLAIAHDLDSLGIDYVEGGWPGANPGDTRLFEDPPALTRARLSAFGMTKRVGRSASNDPGFAALLQAHVGAVCLVGKTWDFHVHEALGTSLEENVQAITESVQAVRAAGREALFDAEHFFDGYRADPAYALHCVEAAYRAGARWVVLCDTNGGTLPSDLAAIVRVVLERIPGTHVGIHTHDDTGNGVATSLAAVEAGVRMVQGTLNGLGERCGNADLTAIIPTLVLKKEARTGVSRERLRLLTGVSRALDERLNRAPSRQAAYVGEAAFVHKGGLHASAVAKDPAMYEHIEPGLVGNRRQVVVSDQAGRSNLLARFAEIGLDIDARDSRVGDLVAQVKEREFQGYSYDGAEASFELLAREVLGEVATYYFVQRFRVIDERRWNARGERVTVSEATIEVTVGDQPYMTAAHGNGPVNALDVALRKALLPVYPELARVSLSDYKVRILTPGDGTGAVTRVMIESRDDQGRRWRTVGVSANIIDASFNALSDAIRYKLFHDRQGGATAMEQGEPPPGASPGASTAAAATAAE